MIDFELEYEEEGTGRLMSQYSYDEGSGLFYNPFGFVVSREDMTRLLLEQATPESRERLDPIISEAILGVNPND